MINITDELIIAKIIAAAKKEELPVVYDGPGKAPSPFKNITRMTLYLSGAWEWETDGEVLVAWEPGRDEDTGECVLYGTGNA